MSNLNTVKPFLLFSRTMLYRHESTAAAVSAIRDFGYNESEYIEDPTVFDDYELLSRFKALIFLSPSGDVLDNKTQKSNLSRFILSGGALIGIHSATSALRDVEAYTRAFGAILDRHSKFQPATFTIHQHAHPSTVCLPPSWRLHEEVYFFQSDPRQTGVSLLVTVDPASFDDPLKNIQKDRQGGHPFPIAWFREAQREGPLAGTGRVWYSSLGHATVLWQDPTFLKHIKGGIDWAIGKDAMTPV